MLALIVFEDKATRLLVRNQIKDIREIDLILESNSAEDALFQTIENKPQIIITADLFSGRSGFELANLIRVNELPVSVIVLSNDPNQALEAIRNQVSDFLVYPFPANKLIDSVNKVIKKINETRPPTDQLIEIGKAKIRINTNEGYKLINIDQLISCVADGSYTKLNFTNGYEAVISYNLGKIENVLKDYRFIRINRSTIINLQKIESIDWKRGICKMDSDCNNIELKITRGCLKKLEESNII